MAAHSGKTAVTLNTSSSEQVMKSTASQAWKATRTIADNVAVLSWKTLWLNVNRARTCRIEVTISRTR